MGICNNIEEQLKPENLTREQKINIIKHELGLSHGKGKRKKKKRKK